MARYGVHPSTDPAKTMRGYKAEHLADPFARYLPRSKRPDESKRPGETSDNRLRPDAWTVADASPTGASVGYRQSQDGALYRCPICGTATTPSRAGHASLCRRCTDAELAAAETGGRPA